ncbi:MAG: hypothetical protein DRO15_01105 [Thermoprotei archaeon]|nr:MAG: hypothetical protein DRO15_01105 [Thermoprotei archaeon]
MYREEKNFNKDLRNLMKKLLLGYSRFFSKSGVLNSDGRKLLEEIIRLLMYEHPKYKPLARKVRKNPTLRNVIRLAELFMDYQEIEELISLALYGPYKTNI